MYNDETPCYRKRAKKITPKKSNHKHEFLNCVFVMPSTRFDEAHGIVHEPDTKYSIGTYCPVCGKIGDIIDREWLAEDKYIWPRAWSERANLMELLGVVRIYRKHQNTTVFPHRQRMVP